MKYQDLNCDELPLEQRVKHLEREAEFNRDYIVQNNRRFTVLTATIFIISFVVAIMLIMQKYYK